MKNNVSLMESDKKIINYLGIIKNYFPNILVKTHQFIDTGWSSDVIIINNILVFRFPKNEWNIDNIRKEKAITNFIRSHVDIKIPNIEIYENNGNFFTVHELIPGIEYNDLDQTKMEEITPKISKVLAKFIADLHSIDFKEFISGSYGKYFPINQFSIEEGGFNMSKINLLYDFIGNNKRIDRLKKTIADFDNASANLNPIDNRIVHSDLTENNIIVNPNTGDIVGIIDFSTVKYRNYSSEFGHFPYMDRKLVKFVANEYYKLTGFKIDLDYAINIQKLIFYGTTLQMLENSETERANRFLNIAENKIDL